MAATVKQLNFIDTLLRERAVPAGVKTQILEIARRPDASPGRDGDVSRVITQLLAMPKAAATTPAPAGTGRPRSINQRLAASVPCARYVLSRDEVAMPGHGVFGGNDHVFIEIREFKGTRFMRQLHGAPGSYTRSKPSSADQGELLDALLAVGPLEATQRYARLYSVCSCCGAELTDDLSRERGMGPVCYRRFV